MSFCVNAPVIKDWPDCCVFDVCFDCALTMPSDQSMAKDFTWGSYLVITILFAIGIWNIFAFHRVYKDNNNYISLMRVANILYAIGTGIFGFCRIHYQLGKPLLISAAIHNLCEWVFVAFAFYKNRKQRECAIFASICWIFLIIGLMVTILTEFPYFALAEQTTGISLDFMLPFIWFILWRQNKTSNTDKEKSTTYTIADIYLIAFIAHLIHILFTILPLVVVNFIRDQNELLSRIIELAIFISVPLTHILYTKVTDLHEEMIDLPSINNNNGSTTDYNDKYVMQISPFDCCGSNNNDRKPFIKMLSWYILCIIIGLFPTVLIPAILPRCTQQSTSSTSAVYTDNIYLGTTKGTVHDGMSEAFEYYIKSKNLVENARNFDGNLFYHFGKDMMNTNTYFIVAGWETEQAADNWRVTDYVQAAFNNYTFAMFEPGKLGIDEWITIERDADFDANINTN